MTKQQRRQYNKTYQATHVEQLRQKRKIYAVAHRDEARAYYWRNKKRLRMLNKIWREANKEHCNEYKRQYYKLHPYKPEDYASMKKWRKNNDKYLKYQRDYQRKYIKAWRKKYFKLNPEKEQEYRENARRSSRNFWLRQKAEKCKCGNTVKQDDYVCISGDKIVKCPKCDENQP